MPQTQPESNVPTHEEGFISSRDGLQLYWQSVLPTAPRAQVVFVHGYSDHSGRYPHVFERLAAEGFGVHAFDYRGHGRSGGRRGHVDRYSQYTDDLTELVAHVRGRVGSDTPLWLVAHSHGAVISTRWLLERPEGIAGAVFSSPFIRLGFEPPRTKVFVATLVGKVIPFLPVGNELVAEDLSRDPAFQEQTRNDPLYGHTTTPRWFLAVQAAQAEIMRRASELVTPMLILQAGDDRIVDPKASREFFDVLTVRDKDWEELAGYRHELFREQDWERPVDRVIAWLAERC